MKVQIKDTAYDAELTLGAIMDYEKETGKKLIELVDGDISSVFQLLYYSLRSTCRRNGVILELSEEEIFDSIPAGDIPQLVEGFSEEIKGAFEKKMPRKERRAATRAKK